MVEKQAVILHLQKVSNENSSVKLDRREFSQQLEDILPISLHRLKPVTSEQFCSLAVRQPL